MLTNDANIMKEIQIQTKIRETTLKNDRPWYLIDPRTNKRLGQWDLVGGLALCYTALVTPFEVSFLPPSYEVGLRWWINRVIDTFFIADMIVQLFIMYAPQQGLTSFGLCWF